jgi:hypothetical protein
MAVGVADMHLAHAPGFLPRWPEDLDGVALADTAERVDVVDPDREPHSLTAATNSAVATAATLAVETQEDLAVT